jgi:cyanate permease
MGAVDVSKIRPWLKTASILIVVNCLATIPSMAYVPLIPAIKKTIAMSGTPLGLFSGLAGILGILCAVPAGMAIKGFGARKVFLSGSAFMIAGLFIAKALQLTTLLFANSMAPNFLSGRDIGPIIAIIALGSSLGQYLGPQIIGILRDAANAYTAGWIYITGCDVVATLFAVGFKIYFNRQDKTIL